MPIYFFDTSALQHRYVSDNDHSIAMRHIISRKLNSCYIANWTFMEIASGFGNRLRQKKKTEPALDVKKEYEKADALFISDVSSGVLRVRATNIRTIRQARELLVYAVRKSRNLSSGDAFIASCALDLAFELRQKVIFYTGDKGLYSVLYDHPEFKAVMCIRLLGMPRDPAMKPRTC